MASVVERLHQELATVAPIFGVAVDVEQERITRVDFDPKALSQAQVAAIAAVVRTFDWSAEAQQTWEEQQARLTAEKEDVEKGSQSKLVRAYVVGLVVLLEKLNPDLKLQLPTLMDLESQARALLADDIALLNVFSDAGRMALNGLDK